MDFIRAMYILNHEDSSTVLPAPYIWCKNAADLPHAFRSGKTSGPALWMPDDAEINNTKIFPGLNFLIMGKMDYIPAAFS
jgi:hypothetical protein